MKNTLRSFVTGELDPSLHYHADLARWISGLKLCRNFIVRAQGGIVNRPGLRFIGEVADSSVKTRLIPFSFNTEQTYILEFSDQLIRVIRNGGYVLDGGGPAIYELATPYLEADLFDLIFVQSADTMTITHRNYAARDLTRADHDDWSLTVIDFTADTEIPEWSGGDTRNIAGVSQSDPGVVDTTTPHGLSSGNIVTISGVLGMTELNGNTYIITVTNATQFTIDVDTTTFGAYVSGGIITFDLGIQQVGTGFGTNNKTYRYVVTATVDGVESLPSEEQSITCGSLDVTAGIRLTWDAVTGADYYTIYKDSANGTGVYGFIGESLNNTFDDYNTAPDLSTTPPVDNTPISSAGDYPGVVGYYQQRRMFANTDNNPQTLFASQTGIYNSMRASRPARDDDAIFFTIAARQVNEIRHIIAFEDLILLTSGASYRITEGQDFVLTPSTIGAKPQAYTGASKIRPATVDDSIIFVQDGETRVRDLSYSIDAAQYNGNDLVIMAEHLTDGRVIVDMDYSREPYGVIWCVCDDGIVIALTYQKEHKVWAWHRHDTDGIFESVAVIREGTRDVPYFVVKRTINGSDVRYVERLEARYADAPANAFFVDSGLSYNGSPVTSVSGLDHLEGKTVVALADGVVVENLVVSSGEITLPQAASIVHVGLSYFSDFETLGIDDAQTSTRGRKKNVSEVIFNFRGSRGGFVGPDFDRLVELKPRQDSDLYEVIALRDYEARVNIQPDWNDDGQIAFRQPYPLPVEIISMTAEFDIGG